jgi:hypothetical protein
VFKERYAGYHVRPCAAAQSIHARQQCRGKYFIGRSCMLQKVPQGYLLEVLDMCAIPDGIQASSPVPIAAIPTLTNLGVTRQQQPPLPPLPHKFQLPGPTQSLNNHITYHTLPTTQLLTSLPALLRSFPIESSLVSHAQWSRCPCRAPLRWRHFSLASSSLPPSNYQSSWNSFTSLSVPP